MGPLLHSQKRYACEKAATGQLTGSHAHKLFDLPCQLMLMLMHVDRSVAKTNKRPSDLPLAWHDDGKAFVIQDRAELCNSWLPVFFGQAKFSSFTRKLYRWGFRQIKYDSKPKASRTNDMHFGHVHFQRDDKSLLSHMQSDTATKRKRQMLSQETDFDSQSSIPPGSLMPGSTVSMASILQPHEQVLALAPYVAPNGFLPSVAAPSATQVDMSNPYFHQLLADAQGPRLFQLAGHQQANSESLMPPQNQLQQDLTAENEYLRQLQLLANATSTYQNSFQLHAPPMPQFPQMAIQQPLFAPPQQAQAVHPADPSNNHQLQLLQALQFMLDQSQPSQVSDPNNPPDGLPN